LTTHGKHRGEGGSCCQTSAEHESVRAEVPNGNLDDPQIKPSKSSPAYWRIPRRAC